jgi:hypothetical protein
LAAPIAGADDFVETAVFKACFLRWIEESGDPSPREPIAIGRKTSR